MSIEREIVRVRDEATREELVAGIEVLRARQRRLPTHWGDAYEDLGVAVDELVDRVREMDSDGSP